MCIYCFLAGISVINEQPNSSTTIPIESKQEDEKTQAMLEGRLMMIFLLFFSSSSKVVIFKKSLKQMYSTPKR